MANIRPPYKFDHIELHLQKHYLETFTAKQLSELGYGTPEAIFYRLNKSRYIRKIKRGVYQFSAWYQPDAKRGKESILDVLNKGDLVPLDEIAEKTGLRDRTIFKNIRQLKAEGYEVERVVCYRYVKVKEK